MTENFKIFRVFRLYESFRIEKRNMKRLPFFILVIVVLLCSSLPSQETSQTQQYELRTWTDETTKKTLRGTFVSLSNGQVTLRTADGSQTVSIALDKLGSSDRSYLRQKRIAFEEQMRTDKQRQEEQIAASGEMVSLFDDDATPIPAGFSKSFRSPFTAIRSVAYSPGGKKILVWGHNNEAILWNNFNGRKEKAFFGNPSGAEIVAFSGDGRLNVTSIEGTKVTLQDTLTGQTLHVFEGHTGIVTPVAMSKNGQWIVSGASDGVALLWNVEKKSLEHRLSLQNENAAAISSRAISSRILSVAFHPKGEHVIIGDDRGTVTFWDVKNGKMQKKFDKMGGPVNSVSFNRTGSAAMLIAPNTAILWDTDVQSSEEIKRRNESGISGGGEMRRNHPILGTETTLALVQPNDGNIQDGLFESVAFSDDDSYFLLVSKIGNVFFGNLKTKQWVRTIERLDSGVNRAGFNADASEYLTVSFNDNAVFRDSNTGDVLEEYTGFNYCVSPIRMTKDGRRIFTSGGWGDPTIAVWDTQSGKLLRRLEGHQAAVQYIEVLPNGKRILTASFEKFDDAKHQFNAPPGARVTNPGKHVILWDVSTGKALVNLDGLDGWALTPKGVQLITAKKSSDRRDETLVQFWDPLTGRMQKELKSPSSLGTDFVMFPDGFRIMAKRGMDTFYWSVAKGTEVGGQAKLRYDLWTAQFTDKGRMLLTGTPDGNAVLWNMQRDTEALSFGGHGGPVISVAISDDGKRVLTGSTDKRAFLWNVETGEQLKQLRAGEGSIVGVAFTEDNRLAMVASEDGVVTFHGIEME